MALDLEDLLVMTSDRRTPLLSRDHAPPGSSPSRSLTDQQIPAPNGRSHALQRALPLEVAGYIEVLVAELRLMAQSAQLESLAYFLDMTRQEAAAQVQRLARCGPDPAC